MVKVIGEREREIVVATVDVGEQGSEFVCISEAFKLPR